MTLTIIVLDPVSDTVSYVLSNAAFSLAKVSLVRAAQTYPILQGFITHEGASVLDFRLIGLLLLGTYLPERHGSNVKDPFHLATADVVSAVRGCDMPVLANLSSVKSVVDDVKKALLLHGVSCLFHLFCLSHRCLDLGKINHFEFGPFNCTTSLVMK
jgi:hypothetical protein